MDCDVYAAAALGTPFSTIVPAMVWRNFVQRPQLLDTIEKQYMHDLLLTASCEPSGLIKLNTYRLDWQHSGLL